MKILYIITSLEVGGAEKLVTDMVVRFLEKGHTIDVVVFNGIETCFTRELIKHKCKIIKFSNNGSVYNPLYIYKLIKLMKNYDIIHTHNSSPQFFAAAANIFCKKTLITTEHNTTNRRRNWKWFKPIDLWMYNQYKGIVCISDKAFEKLTKHLPKIKANIVTIYNGVNISKFHNAGIDIGLNKAKKEFSIAMVAGFRFQKDQDTLIKAMALLPKNKFELWLVGDGERRNEIETLAKQLKVEDSVKFLGIRTNIPEILHTADIIVMSSHYEGLSLSSIEGMAVGKPFVASNVDGLNEMTKDAGIMFEHGNALELSQIITQLSEDENYYKSIAKQCYKKALLYDESKMIGSYENLYKSLIK